MYRYHPRRHLRDRHPDTHVDCSRDVEEGLLGEWVTPLRIRLSRRLTQTGRRCTTTHDVVHVERGPVAAERQT